MISWLLALLFLKAEAQEIDMCYEPLMCYDVPVIEEIDSVYCYCVAYLREILGVNVQGDADQLTPNLPLFLADSGDIALLDYNGVIHASLIVEKLATGLLVRESNFKYCEPTERIIPYSAPFVGFYRPL